MNPYIYSKKIIKDSRSKFVCAALTYRYEDFLFKEQESYVCSDHLIFSLKCIIPNILFGISVFYSMGISSILEGLFNLYVAHIQKSKNDECEKSLYMINGAIHSTGNMELTLQLCKCNIFYDKWDRFINNRIYNMRCLSIYFSTLSLIIGGFYEFYGFNDNMACICGGFFLILINFALFHKSRYVNIYPTSNEIMSYKTFLEKIYFLEEALGENIFNHHMDSDDKDK